MSDSDTHPCDQCKHTDCYSLYDTSYLPSDCPISCDACSSLTKIDAEISPAHSHLVELSKRRRTLRSFINERHDPFTRLPNEMVSEIFKFYCMDYSEFLGRQGPVSVLGRVCKWWRQVTLSTPQLWCGLTIRANNKRPDNLEITGAWLIRSRSLPLSLDITQSYNYPRTWTSDPETDTLSSLIQLLRSHSARWQDLYVDSGGEIIIQSLLHNLMNLPSNLETFSCDQLSLYDIEEYNEHRLLLPKKVEMSLGSTIVGLPFGWDRLTSIFLYESMHLQDFLDVVSCAPNLEECLIFSILGPDEELEPPDPSTPVISHSMTSLHIERHFNDPDNPSLISHCPL